MSSRRAELYIQQDPVSKNEKRLGLVIHTCNPSYLGGRDWEDCGLRPAWAKS
jgi:hypothetical protein